MNIPRAVLIRAVAALRYQAHNEAGQSQAPDLFSAEDTQQWKDAKTISTALRENARKKPK